ncbi:MAG: hypothetical protein LBR64_05480 [Dysgonamonadaceae bacterium]|jgi:hypothetical protein|nr:hypothetical protein [Dysgonamonadaceae bacterium]
MKKFILILAGIFLGMFSFAQKQFSGIYHIENFDESVSCSIEFHESGCYELELSKKVTGDMINTLLLSSGKFKVKGSKITLYDDAHNYKMIFSVLENKELKVLEGFCCIILRNFVYYGPPYERDCLQKPETTSAEQQKERILYKKTHKTVYPFDLGSYNGFFSQLNLQSDGRYTLYFYNVLISDGIWGKDENEIYLYDANLHHNFYVLVGDGKLIGKYLPGYFEGDNVLVKGNVLFGKLKL